MGFFKYGQMKTIFNLLLIFGLALAVRAQDEVPPPMPEPQTLTDAQLDQLLGPIALYPDPLLSVLLPAATFPTEIVEADRYVSNGGDPNQIAQQPWDPSVQAMAHYPSVLSWMDDNLNWTTQVGEAFQNQQQDVMSSIQRLRMTAYNLGNLQSTPQQQVINDNGNIEILPVSPNNLYVPDYQPNQVFYQAPYGPPFITFSTVCFIGPWLTCDFNWGRHCVVFWDHNHPRPAGWWGMRPDQRVAYFDKHSAAIPAWNPANRPNVNGFQGDRGWANQNARGGYYQSPRGGNTPNNRTWNAPAVNRPAPAPNFNYQRPQDNSFIGDQSARQARDFSQRGQQSMQSGGAPRGGETGGGAHFEGGGAPAGGGGGGGFHGGGGGGGAPAGGGGGGGGGHGR